MVHPPDLTKLRYFLAVAESLSFSEASAALNIAQPAISRAVHQLEMQLGFKLLERSTRRVALTPAGAALAEEMGDVLLRLGRALTNAQQVAAGTAGEILLGYSTFGASGPMASMIVAFRERFPNAHVGLQLLSSREQIEALERGTIDLGFPLVTVCRPPIRHLVISRERFVLLVAKKHPLARRDHIDLHEIAGEPFVIGTPVRWFAFRAMIMDLCGRAGFVPNIVDEADDTLLLMQLVLSGSGVSLYGSSIIPILPRGVAAVEVRDPHATIDVAIAWHEQKRSPLVRGFVETARAMSGYAPS